MPQLHPPQAHSCLGSAYRSGGLLDHMQCVVRPAHPLGDCWMVALTACSRALRLPLSSYSLVKIMYMPSWRGDCCRAFGGGGPGGGVVVVGGFLLFPLTADLSRCPAEWCLMLACQLHCETCMVGSSYPQRCKGPESGPVVFL